MSLQLAARAKRFGLRYVDVKELCLKRRRKGERFVYVDARGKPIRSKKVLARIAALAVPPAWEEVCLADDPSAHIQAIGRDSEGRLQYRYNDDWVLIRDKIKAERLLRFGRALPRIRAKVEKDLRRRGTGRRSAAAAASRLVDRALIRAGHSADGVDNGGRGAATLLKRDVKLNGTSVALDFIGKGGKRIEASVKDPTLLARLRKLKTIGKKRLFAFRNRKGKVCYLTATDLNKYLRDAAGKRVTAKDFRTFAATAQALAELAGTEVPESERKVRKVLGAVMKGASERLANTPAVARSSYVHPLVVETFAKGGLDPALVRGPCRQGLDQAETALMRFLEDRFEGKRVD